MIRSSLYRGTVNHARHRPRRHAFRYRAWWLLLDLDELPRLQRSVSFFSHNRFNLCAVHDRDYGNGSGDLRRYVEGRLAEADLGHAGRRISLLTMPRLLGYAFNPLSVYFCRDDNDRIAAIIYEVHNTFGERHSYVIEASAPAGEAVRQTADKAFYVSPFMAMDLAYDFRVADPGASIALSILSSHDGEPVLSAALQGKRLPLSSWNLLRLCITHPMSTLKVLGAIHWEALRLWCKGMKVVPRSPHVGHAATRGRPIGQSRAPHE